MNGSCILQLGEDTEYMADPEWEELTTNMRKHGDPIFEDIHILINPEDHDSDHAFVGTIKFENREAVKKLAKCLNEYLEDTKEQQEVEGTK